MIRLSSFSTQFVIAKGTSSTPKRPGIFHSRYRQPLFFRTGISCILSSGNISVLRSLVYFFFIFVSRPGGRGPSILQWDPHQFPLSFACPDFQRHWLTSPCAVAFQLAANRLHLLYPKPLDFFFSPAPSCLAVFSTLLVPIRALRHPPNPAVCYSSPRPAYDVDVASPPESRRAQLSMDN